MDSQSRELHPVTFFEKDKTPEGIRDFRPRRVPQDVDEEGKPDDPAPEEPELSRPARGAAKD